MIVFTVIGCLAAAWLIVGAALALFTDVQSNSDRLFQVQLMAAYPHLGLKVKCVEWSEGYVVTVNGVDGKPGSGGGVDSFKDALDKIAARDRGMRKLPSYKESQRSAP